MTDDEKIKELLAHFIRMDDPQVKNPLKFKYQIVCSGEQYRNQTDCVWVK